MLDHSKHRKQKTRLNDPSGFNNLCIHNINSHSENQSMMMMQLCVFQIHGTNIKECFSFQQISIYFFSNKSFNPVEILEWRVFERQIYPGWRCYNTTSMTKRVKSSFSMITAHSTVSYSTKW